MEALGAESALLGGDRDAGAARGCEYGPGGILWKRAGVGLADTENVVAECGDFEGGSGIERCQAVIVGANLRKCKRRVEDGEKQRHAERVFEKSRNPREGLRDEGVMIPNHLMA